MNEQEEHIPLSEAAKRLGINRSTLSRFIDEAGLKKTKQGRCVLVNVRQVQELVTSMAAKGKIRTPKASNKQDKNPWEDLYREAKREKEKLEERCLELEAMRRELEGSIKLLKAAGSMQEKRNIFTKLGEAWDILF